MNPSIPFQTTNWSTITSFYFVEMKFLIAFFAFILLIGCRPSPLDRGDTKQNFDPNWLVGEWYVDSSSNNRSLNDKLVFMGNGIVYDVSWSDGGSIRKFHKLTFDTILTEYGEKLPVQVIDSTRILVSGQYSPWRNYYKRRTSDTAEISNYLAADSLRKQIIGWWKVRQLDAPFDMLFNHSYCLEFSLNFRDNGEVLYYPDNNLDSVLSYNYHTNADGVSINKGCIVGGAEINIDSLATMTMYFQNGNDTLIFDRIRHVQ